MDRVIEMCGIIYDIARWSGHDGPGIRSVVFFKGCPLHCAWCHNPESQRPQRDLLYMEIKCIGCGRCVQVCPTGARQWADGLPVTDRARCEVCGQCVAACYSEALQLAGRIVTAEEVVEEIAKDAVFYHHSGGGVTLSGGEPMAQPHLAEGIARGCHEMGIHVALETCGAVAWSVLERMIPFVDLFLCDLKIIDEERHRVATGVSNRRTLANLKKLAATGKSIQIRVPLIPGYTDDDANLAAICQVSTSLGLGRIAFLPYNPSTGAKYVWLDRDCSMPSLERQSNERLEAIRLLGESYGLEVQIGG